MYTRPPNAPYAVPPVSPLSRVPSATDRSLPEPPRPWPATGAQAHAGACASVYTSVAQESAAIGAAPAQLITLLFDAARGAIVLARHHMARGDVAGKGRAVSRAVGIIGHGLKASLDAGAGGSEGAKLVASLEPLYDYICQRLVLGNLRNDPALLEEAERLLENVASAWRTVTHTGAGGDAAAQGRP